MGVICLAVNSDGVPIRPSRANRDGTQMSDEQMKKYASSISELAMRARSAVRDLDPTVIPPALVACYFSVSSTSGMSWAQNDLTFLRIRSKKNEIMVAPGVPLFARQ